MGVGVLVSGTGTILEAILATPDLPVDVVIADRRCRALEIAEQANVPAELVERTDFGKSFDRDGYTQLVVDVLRKYDVTLVASAGFGTVIPRAVDAFPGRMLNTHPSLLPAFKGWHPVRDALAAGVKITGWTVHVMTDEMDAGTIVAQEAVRVYPHDTEETLHERIKEVERRLFPAVIKSYLEEIDG